MEKSGSPREFVEAADFPGEFEAFAGAEEVEEAVGERSFAKFVIGAVVEVGQFVGATFEVAAGEAIINSITVSWAIARKMA